MKIIIAGAGEVGYHIAQLLSQDLQDIVVIDINKERLSYIESKLDVITLHANAVSPNTLKSANVDQTDLLIAVTQSETSNITIGMIGKQLGAKRTIVRVSNSEFLKYNQGVSFQKVGIDSMISPAALVTEELKRLLQQTGVTDAVDFGDGRLKLVGIHLLEQNCKLLKSSVKKAAQRYKKPLMPVAIRRGSDTIIPRGDSEFHYNDFAYFVCKSEDTSDLLRFTGKKRSKIKNVMIVGGSQIGRQTTMELGRRYNIKLIEQCKNKCHDLASMLPEALIIHGDARNIDLLKEESIDEMDAFIAVTGNSETNIMSCLVAKSLGVRQTIALVENMGYIHLSQTIGIDTLLNKKLLAASHIFKYVREGDVVCVGGLHGVDAEILEFDVKDNALITRAPIRELRFPPQAVIGGVVRDGQGFTPLGDFKVKPHDRVVVFSMADAVHQVEQFFK